MALDGGFKSGLVWVLLLALASAEGATVEFASGGFNQQVTASNALNLELKWPSILRLYASHDEQPFWHDGNTLNERGRLLLSFLSAADREGLNPADYHIGPLQRLPESLPENRLPRELLLSDGYLRLALDLRLGKRTARALDPFGLSRADDFDPVAALLEALRRDRFVELLDGLRPSSAEYQALRQALARYRGIEKAGGWPRLEADFSLRPGQRSHQVVGLRKRLALEAGQPVAGGEDPELFDRGLVEAVKRYQRLHGLEPDALVGPATREALNVPVRRRIAQLRANLERWRWLPREPAPDYLLVNTAGFNITWQSHDNVIFSGRTVSGRAERPTPLLISRITHLVANPRWTLPRRIAVEDMLPQQQADPGYLASKRIRAYRHDGGDWVEFDPSAIDWTPYDADDFPFILRQDAGPHNSLGRIKFHLPNTQGIYLHDTPAVGLFERSRRALSSGCIRVEGAERLARLLLARAAPWDARKFMRAMRTGETQSIQLTESLPVYLTYFTSWVDAAGGVHFHPDIYQRDADLMWAIGADRAPVTAQSAGAFTPASL